MQPRGIDEVMLAWLRVVAPTAMSTAQLTRGLRRAGRTEPEFEILSAINELCEAGKARLDERGDVVALPPDPK